MSCDNIIIKEITNRQQQRSATNETTQSLIQQQQVSVPEQKKEVQIFQAYKGISCFLMGLCIRVILWQGHQ